MTNESTNAVRGAFRSRALTLVLTTWAVLAVLELALVLATGQSRRTLGPFSLLDRVTLVAAELVALLFVSVVIALPVRGFRRLGNPGRERAWRRLGGGAAIAWAGGVAFLLGSSWLTFLVTGEFLNWTGVRLWLSSPVQMVQHGADVETVRLLLVPAFVVLGSVLFGAALPRLAERLGELSRAGLNRKLVVLLALCLALTVLGEERAQSQEVVVDDPQGGRVYSLGDYYEQVRAEGAGPAVRAASEIWGAMTGGPHGLDPSERLAVTRDSILAPGAYAGLASEDSASARRYNVLLVLVESLRPDQLAAYGATRSVMPHVDSVAAEGRVYLDTYAQSSHSNYSDISPLASQYPLRSGRMYVYPEVPPYPTTLLYDVLSEVGYRTAIFSSQNENWGGMLNFLSAGRLDTVFHSETFRGSTYIPAGDFGFERFATASGRAGKVDDRHTVDAAIDWIRRDDPRPFFVYMNLQNSHIPYRTPGDFRRFGPDSVDFTIQFGAIEPEKIGIVKDVYANSLAYVDAQLGRLFTMLRASGRWDSTIVIVTGDTGQAFLEHGFLAHAGDLYNEVVKVPLVVRAPGLEPGRDERPAEHVDVPPTVLDLVGLPPFPGFQGESLVDSTTSEDPQARFLVAQSPLAHQYGVVVGDWKLLYDVRRGVSLLFDLAEDPGEHVNLAEQRPQVVEELEGILGAWSAAQIRYYDTPALYRTWYPPDYRLTDTSLPEKETSVAR